MAHYAFLNKENIVTEVIVGKNEFEDDINWEQWYGDFRGQKCLRTSYNTFGGIHYNSVTREPSEDQSRAFRKNYAGIGYFYDQERDAFIPPKPFDSWILNEDSCLWEQPIPYPNDGKAYYWVEENQQWVEIEIPE